MFDDDDVPLGVYLVVLLIIVLIALGIGIAAAHHESWRDITVCSKGDVATSDGHQYRIYAADDTYTMTDSYLGGVRTDTANDYGKILDKTSYHVKIKGFRVTRLSWFPNILEFDKLPADQQHPELCPS